MPNSICILFNHELKVALPVVLSILKSRKGVKKAIKNREIRVKCFSRGVKLTEVRLRKIIEYIRNENLLGGLIARQFGYFVADNPEDILQWVETLKKKKKAIDATIKSAMDSYDVLVEKSLKVK